MSGLPALVRPFALVTAALFTAFFLFRVEVASALVSRGDAFLYRGNLALASQFYDRALHADSSYALAADRYAFATLEQPTTTGLRRAVEAITAALRGVADPSKLLAKRGLCYEHLGRFDRAQIDFAQAGRAVRSERYMTLAGWSAWRNHDRHVACIDWKAALAFAPRSAAARIALRGRCS